MTGLVHKQTDCPGRIVRDAFSASLSCPNFHWCRGKLSDNTTYIDNKNSSFLNLSLNKIKRILIHIIIVKIFFNESVNKKFNKNVNMQKSIKIGNLIIFKL